MNIAGRVKQRFAELEQQMRALQPVQGSVTSNYPADKWASWATSVMNLLAGAFGPTSVHFVNFKTIYDKYTGWTNEVDKAKGVFVAAKEDWEGGYLFNVESAVSGEIFGDFVLMAREALANGNHEAAAVLACAALEDALKRFAASKGLDVSDKVMQEVIAALKAQGLISGAQKTLLDTMPKIRDYAMHANWSKLTSTDSASVIGFVEQFLVVNF